ncbi:hydrophobic surface binding protein A-domain-containing protein [Infundibulicybe gibba]|nr:hydrophobic surface binding protein A-domain-containing protein [Infundibulicybe gibba]
MRFPTVLVFASLASTGFAAPIAQGTVAQVKADIAKIATQVHALDNAVTKPGGSLLSGLTLQASALGLKSALDAGTVDAKATSTPIAESDAKAIFMAIQGLEPTIQHTLKQTIANKSALEKIPVTGISGLVLQTLKGLQASSNAFATALIAIAPGDLKTEANAIKSNIDVGFEAAIKAYS